jgi:glycosyltransferase involved in cell wall biosynthesis
VNAGVFARDLALELARMGHEVHVITPAKPAPVIPEPPLHLHVIGWPARERDLASVSMRNPATVARFMALVVNGLWSVPCYARRQHLDALLSLWVIPSGLFAWLTQRLYGIPYGVWALGSDIWSRKKYPFGEAIVRRVLRAAAFRFADGVNLAREAAVLAGVTCEFVASVRRLPSDGEHPLRLKPDLRHFLYIGRYEHNKGPDVLVEAMRLLLDAGTKAHLHMFGAGSLESALRQRIHGYEEYITLRGYADPATVVSYMQACDWLVIPSRIESIPLIFADALQMRLPVVTTSVGDLGELVREYRVGIAVPPEDPSALAEAMQWATHSARAEYSTALERASRFFDLAHSAHRCAEALEAIMTQ